MVFLFTQACRTAAIEGTDAVSGVRLADGTVIPAELVVISAGVRANTALASAAGLETERAVVVDGHMRTSVPDIYGLRRLPPSIRA